MEEEKERFRELMYEYELKFVLNTIWFLKYKDIRFLENIVEMKRDLQNIIDNYFIFQNT